MASTTPGGRPALAGPLTRVCLLVVHVLTVALGVVGLAGDTAASVVRVLGPDTAAFAWSSVFVVFGAVALVARLRARLRLEAVAVLAIAAGFALWAVMIAVGSGVASLQSALTVAVIAVFKTGWGALLWRFAGQLVFVIDRGAAGAAP